MLTVLHSGMSCGVTFDQAPPPLRVSWTRPSSVPTQIMPFFSGDSAMAKIVS